MEACLNFILYEMTSLRYFIPLIIEAGNRGKICRVFYGYTSKYNSPSKYLDVLKQMATQYGFGLYDIKQAVDHQKDTFFLIEGVGIDSIMDDCVHGKVIVLTSLRDFAVLYDDYVGKADAIVMPSKFFAEHYGKVSPKNLYIGSPKYDVVYDNKQILKFYELPATKKALVLFPNLEYLPGVNVAGIIGSLKDLGYCVVVKSRGKHHAPAGLRGDRYFEDAKWFPHTSLELMSVCDIIINFSSTSIKECVMMNKPVVNVDAKPHQKHFQFLYDYDYAKQLDRKVSMKDFRRAVEVMAGRECSGEYKKSRDAHLFEPGEVSKKILEYCLGA